MSAGRGGQALHAANLLPDGIRAAAVLVYLAILAAHLVHVRHTSGQRRLWHVGHVAMAIGMLYMFLPASALPVSVGAGAWQALYGIGLGLLAAWLVGQTINRGGASGLWLLLAFDFVAMVYMWSPSAMHGSLSSWLVIAYLSAEGIVWLSGGVVDLDRNVLPGGAYSVSIVIAGAGAVPSSSGSAATAPATATLACERDLRVSLSAMTFGMAYMLLAMLAMR